MTLKFDFLVIGSGIAGLTIALKTAKYGKVCVITKTGIDETNTRYAQGGIAAVTYQPDSFEKHVKDTLIAGAGLCSEDIVRMVVSEAPERINDLIEWGMSFDKNTDGSYNLAREGGHTEHRILHHKDNTGNEIQKVLSVQVKNNPNITVLENHFTVDLITQHHLGISVRRINTDIECYGAYVMDLNKHQIFKILAKTTFICTGGVGNLYLTTTNPNIATGDGIAMVHRAKGTTENMEFIQFHPTSLFNPGERPSFLITEALRGFGAILKTIAGKEFMHEYDSRGSLAPRDIVARAIDYEMKKRGEDFVYIDATQSDKNELIYHFPNIYAKCLKIGIDITRDPIPVVPAAHYLCGGIKVDANGCTHIHHLYATGETASTGLHGANRLASNSLVEALVFAHRAAQHAVNIYNDIQYQENIPEWNDKGTTHPRELILITQNTRELHHLMSYYVGIVRSDSRLKRAYSRLEMIYNETEELYKTSKISQKLCELRNLITVGYLVIKAAQARKESIGLHYNIDHASKKIKTIL
ncbi:MAG: L-aspartate oxidase [Bacteroidetes bacterium CG23_combo_of_CG06-09_8_20_14_all_32_9]|nr:MAG: L-aspartate oxidase [Bacteroidetes bacterium CG23_combo_of_CG06-09_8_20_14_all_32_9]